ncbi:RNA polymerase sigma factor SigD [Corynebacterium phocae]|uniref:RNA polymerase sigma factor SigD n=1 Tax=Corynebacterium phocae TaxID=161895 RepID=A0A1L7D4T2_9CORY|nr:sigma-70 family RNA polymerase sigma factor [Corynebacterium phocae]APT93186.1 RNA polymerase sigma factor SigD [Corynebacterium phocae]KAA8721921.1 sigma-70 family RNA polymerase sigma factor [Corynebacterium phocae]
MNDLDKQLAELVPRGVDGDSHAIGEIMRLIHPQVLRYSRARIGGYRQPTPEDVAQEICLAVATSIGGFKDTGRPFMAYVYGIAFNKVTDAHRAMGRDYSSPAEDLPETPDTEATPEEQAVIAAGSNEVRALLDNLNDKARDIVILRVFNGLSAEETAAIVGSTPGAVRVAQHRALAQLRKAVTGKNQTRTGKE